ncbi:MAG TPA: hypothetical protein PKD29_08855 [Rhodocyclaceae bacterium]|nr:hypothetical protein [Rhodocyclaceae bacterium]
MKTTTRVLRHLACLALAGTLPPAFGQAPSADPTRPPDAVPALAGEASAEQGLQSVMIPKSGRARALIGGRWVAVGEKIGESVLVRVRQDGVVLRGPAGTETLALTPSVAKTPVQPAKAGKGRVAPGKKETP